MLGRDLKTSCRNSSIMLGQPFLGQVQINNSYNLNIVRFHSFWKISIAYVLALLLAALGLPSPFPFLRFVLVMGLLCDSYLDSHFSIVMCCRAQFPSPVPLPIVSRVFLRSYLDERIPVTVFIRPKFWVDAGSSCFFAHVVHAKFSCNFLQSAPLRAVLVPDRGRPGDFSIGVETRNTSLIMFWKY